MTFDLELSTNKKWLFIGGSILFFVSASLLLMNFLNMNTKPIILVGYSIISLIMFIHSYRFWFRKLFGLVLHVTAGFFYLCIGLIYFYNQNILYQYYQVFLFILTVAFITIGAFRLFIALSQDLQHGWIWTLYTGLINIILCFYLFYDLSIININKILSSTEIDVLFTGIALFALSRKLNRDRNEKVFQT